MSRGFLAVFVMLAAGCGDDPAPSVDGGTSTSDAATDGGSESPDASASAGSLTAYCHPLAMSVCASAADCSCGDVLVGGFDEAGCAAQFEATCIAAWQPFVDAGAVVDDAAASACAALVDARTERCAEPSAIVAFGLCAPFAVDPAELGESCTTPYCAGGDGRCVQGESGAMCGPRVTEGGSCDDMFACATGLVCAEGTCTALLGDGATGCTSDAACLPPFACVDGTCERRHALDEACTSDEGCSHGLRCLDGTCAERSALACASDPTSDLASEPCGNLEQCARPSTCRAPRLEGASCGENADCDAALYCASGVCTARPGEGELCGNGVSCAEGLGCDADGADGRCRALPTAGSSCLFGETGPFLCADGLACSGGTCAALPTEGQPCAGVDTCAEGLGCAFGPKGSICVVPRAEGEACENRQACRADLFCGPSGTCEPDVAIGEACSVDLGNCGAACVPDGTGAFVCASPVAEGMNCLDDTDCATGLTCLARAEDSRCIGLVCSAL